MEGLWRDESGRLDLEKSICDIVARQAALAFADLKEGFSSGSGGDRRARSAGSERDCIASTSRSGSRGQVGVHGKARTTDDIIEPFDPDHQDCNVERWLSEIDQIGAINEWSDYERVSLMQAKLRGPALDWFDKLDKYDLTWGEWKAGLRQAFPPKRDYAELLMEMLARVKLASESMTHYYNDKIVLCERCEILGEKAISCIIKGLPADLQGAAKAFKCSSPGDLYVGFLSDFDRHKATPELKRRNHEGHSLGKRSRRMTSSERRNDIGVQGKRQMVRCFNCQEMGYHVSKECPRSRVDRCMWCGKPGHDKVRCPQRREATKTIQGKRR